jgi:glycosyltransferase involved in cell wall biosynthesis
VRILYDAPFLSNPKAGVARYFRELSRSIAQKHEVHFSRRVFVGWPGRINPLLPPFPHFRPHRLAFALEKLWFKIFVRDPFDIVHAGEYAFTPTGSLAIARGAKRIVTVHDLIHEKFGAPGNLYDPERRSAFYSSADGLLFVSESTCRDFFGHYEVDPKKTPHAVVHHGLSFPPTANAHGQPNQFLFVGSREGYKNFPNAVEAFALFSANIRDSRLFVAGAPPNDLELRLVKSFSNQVEWLAHPDDKRLSEAYRSSIGLLYISEYEGFGLPLLEAMSQGCVPIAGEHSSIPEVLGEAGVKTDISDPLEIARAMQALTTDIHYRKERISSGLKRIEAFSWEKTATQSLALYEEALSSLPNNR